MPGEVTGPAEDASGVVDTVLDAVAEAAERVGERAFRARGHRLVGVGALREEQCERLATLAPYDVVCSQHWMSGIAALPVAP